MIELPNVVASSHLAIVSHAAEVVELIEPPAGLGG